MGAEGAVERNGKLVLGCGWRGRCWIGRWDGVDSAVEGAGIVIWSFAVERRLFGLHRDHARRTYNRFDIDHRHWGFLNSIQSFGILFESVENTKGDSQTAA